MFKQSKKQSQSNLQQNLFQTLPSSHYLKEAQFLPRQLLEFIARQITILKDISLTCSQNHPDITSNRLNECIHLLQKKMSYSLGDNPEQYHDYIQDFYEDQLNNLRNQLNICKMQTSNLRKQLKQMKSNYEIINQERQNYLKLNLDTIQTNGDVSKNNKNEKNNIMYYEQNSKLKKELDHCRILLQQNSFFIQQQAKAIENLSCQLKSKQKQLKTIRDQYEQKIIQFDEYIDVQTSKFQSLTSTLATQQKSYQQQLKDLALIKIRILQQRNTIQKQLQMKVQEIHLLTKKVLQDQMLIAKLEKALILKEKVVEQLYQEIDSVQGSISRIGRKQEDFHKLYQDKNEQIMRMQQRIRTITQTNEKLEKKQVNLSRKLQQSIQQNKVLDLQFQKLEKLMKIMEQQLQASRKKLKNVEKTLSKVSTQKQNLQGELRILQSKYEQVQKRKKDIRKDIQGQINQLIKIVQQNTKQKNSLLNQRQLLIQQLRKETQYKNRAEENLMKINELNAQIQNQIQFLHNQNKELNETKDILQKQLSKMNSLNQKILKIQKQLQITLLQKQNLAHQLHQFRNLNKSASQIPQKKQCEQCQSLKQFQKQYNEKLSKKDFQIKQMDSKIKTLQEEARANSKLYENQKSKTSHKIKELQQLLRQRYELSSRFSQSELPTGTEDYLN